MYISFFLTFSKHFAFSYSWMYLIATYHNLTDYSCNTLNQTIWSIFLSTFKIYIYLISLILIGNKHVYFIFFNIFETFCL